MSQSQFIQVLRKFLVASTTAVCLVLLGNGFGIAKTDTIEADTRHNGHSHGADTHPHDTMEIPPGQPVPSVDLVVHKDPMSGWNLETKVTDFRFAPENASKAAKPGEGHAHLYVNGKKVARLYGGWYHLDHLPSGRHELKLGLNANSHEALVHNGKQIEDTEIVEVTTVVNRNQHSQ